MALNSYPAATVDSSPYAYRNLIRNGDFSVAQRGTFLGFPAGQGGWNNYTLDGWYLSASGLADVNSYSGRGAYSPGFVDSKYVGMFNVQGQTTSSHYFQLTARIEDVTKLAGKKATLSFSVFAGNGGASRISAQFVQRFGTGGSAQVTTNLGTFPVSTDTRRQFVTFNVPSISGKTIGTDHCLYVSFWFSGGSSNEPDSQGIGLRNNQILLSKVQLEEGPFATPFEELPNMVQLMWNQRYFYRSGSAEPYCRIASGPCTTATLAYPVVILPVEMRKAPTFSLANATQTYLWNGVTNYPATAATIDVSHPRSPSIGVTASGGGMTQGQQMHWTNGGTGAVAAADFSAEL